MIPRLLSLAKLTPNPLWAKLPLFDRKGWKTVRWGAVANLSELTRERAQSFLTDDHLERIVKAYERFKGEPGFTRVASLEEIRAKDGNLSIPLYVASMDTVAKPNGGTIQSNLPDALNGWLESSKTVRESLITLLKCQKS